MARYRKPEIRNWKFFIPASRTRRSRGGGGRFFHQRHVRPMLSKSKKQKRLTRYFVVLFGIVVFFGLLGFRFRQYSSNKRAISKEVNYQEKIFSADSFSDLSKASYATGGLISPESFEKIEKQVEEQVRAEERSRQKGKAIDVNLTTQTMTVFKDNEVVKTFTISSGEPGRDTPTGSFEITVKYASKVYGCGSSHDYCYPDTPWNMRYSGPYLIHTAYWHDDFGTPVSHGCINMKESEAKWLYDWAPVGTAVEIHY